MINGTHITTGKKGQELAEAFFERHGLRVIARNYRHREAEMDLVLLDQVTLVFAEIKCRQNDRYGSGLYAVTEEKKRKLITAALLFLKSEKRNLRRLLRTWPPRARFDVLAIAMRGDDPQYQWIASAFELDDLYGL